MFRTRSPLDSDDPKADAKFEIGLSTIPEDNSMELEQEDASGASTSLMPGDSSSSFRRSVRDGTISTNEEPQEDAVMPQNLQVSKLSFTDLLVENELSKIQLRKGRVNRAIDKRKTKRGLDMTRIQKKVTVVRGYESPEFPEEATEELSVSQGQSESEFVETEEQNKEITMEQQENKDGNVEMNGRKQRELTQKFRIPEDEMDFDIEIDLSQVVNEMEEELLMMNDKIQTISNLIAKNGESLSGLKMEELEIERELGAYFLLFETSKNLRSLVDNKEPDLLKTLKVMKKNRIEECEYLLRLRRWLLCDLVTLVKGPSVDYRCGKLEDVDEFGKDMSLRIERTFSKRVKKLETIKREFEERSLKEADGFRVKFRGGDLGEYLVKEVRDLFRIKMEEDYQVEELRFMYDYDLHKEESEGNFMGDVTEEFRSVLTPVILFRDFKEENKEDYEMMKLEENLKQVFVFYAKMAMVTWNTLENGTPERSEWFREFIEFEPRLLRVLVDELFYELVFEYIEYFDIESERECRNLAKFIKFVIENLPRGDQSRKLEKIISELENSLRTKVEMMSITLDQGKANESLPPGTSGTKTTMPMSSATTTMSTATSTLTRTTLTDPVVLNMVKFNYLNLMASVMCFSDIMSSSTLSNMVVDDLFVRKLVPLLDYESKVDAYVALNFKVITMPLKREMEMKTKSSEVVKFILERFTKSEWRKGSNLGVFEELEVPIDIAKYKELINM